METVEVAGLRIAYQRAGQGPPLVLFHGAYEDSRIWRPQLEDLSDDFTVFAWDAPGCGGSDDPPPDFTGRTWATPRQDSCGKRCPAKPHILGLSVGLRHCAGALPRVHPSVPASLVLVSAYAGWAGSLPPEEVERRYAQVLAESISRRRQFIPEWLPTLFTDNADPAAVHEASAIMADVRPAGMRALLYRQRPGRLPRRAAHHQRFPPSCCTARTISVAAERGPRDEPADPGLDAGGDSRRRAHGAVEAPAAFNAEVRRFLHGLCR